jgi:hypothetical protein
VKQKFNPGTACDDGNPNTGNDVIQADGCTCAGTPITTCSISATVSSILCDSKNTSDPSDDTYTFLVTVYKVGSCTASNWVSIAYNKSGAYGTPVLFGPFPISGGNKSVTIVDCCNPNATTTVTAVAPAPCSTGGGGTCNRTALFVVGSLPLGTGDQAVKNVLDYLGFSTTLADDDLVQAADGNGKGVVIISSTVGSSVVGAKFRDIAVPVLTWEAWIYSAMQMTGTATTEYGKDGSFTNVNIVNSAHPLAAGLSGSVTLFDYARAISWGKPSGSAIKIAALPTDASKSAIFAYDTGASMVGKTAPAKRIGFYLDNFTGTGMTAMGKGLLEAAILWATNCSTGVAPRTVFTFDVNRDGVNVGLNWTNNTGFKNDKFIVEKSADGVDFSPLLERSSLSNDDVLKYYDDIDYEPFTGDNFYRVKLVYRDGSFDYSNIRKVNIADIEQFGLYPNPASDYVDVVLKDVTGKNVTMHIADQLGRVVKVIEMENVDGVPYRIDLNGMHNGMYSLWIFTDKQKPIGKKLIVERY